MQCNLCRSQHEKIIADVKISNMMNKHVFFQLPIMVTLSKKKFFVDFQSFKGVPENFNKKSA